jgi:hypothetical protein
MGIANDTSAAPNLLRLTTKWEKRTAVKVPSKISYSPSLNCKQWGYDIDHGSDTMQWTKLDLDYKTTVDYLTQLKETVGALGLRDKLYASQEDDAEPVVPTHISLDSAEIMRDYLQRVIAAWQKQYTAALHNLLGEVPIDIVVTHPAVRQASPFL